MKVSNTSTIFLTFSWLPCLDPSFSFYSVLSFLVSISHWFTSFPVSPLCSVLCLLWHLSSEVTVRSNSVHAFVLVNVPLWRQEQVSHQQCEDIWPVTHSSSQRHVTFSGEDLSSGVIYGLGLGQEGAKWMWVEWNSIWSLHQDRKTKMWELPFVAVSGCINCGVARVHLSEHFWKRLADFLPYFWLF